MADLSLAEARQLAVTAQGLGRARPRAPRGPGQVEAVAAAMGAVQLDAVNVVTRSQQLVVFSRIGAHDADHLRTLATPPEPALFEYWGHAACLLPATLQPLLRWRMDEPGPYGHTERYRRRIQAWYRAHADYIDSVRAEVRARGPLTAAQLSEPRRRDGQWWDRRSVGRQALEWLFFRGEVAAWRTPSFERVYDCAERVLPPAVLARPTPAPEEAHRELLARAATALGVATLGDLADYFRLRPAQARPRVAELVEEGTLTTTRVEGWDDPAYVMTDLRSRRPSRRGATVLSPFDPLVWERARTRRLFGFEYRIEIYVPGPERRWGYYVLPVLMGDALVARVDVKADRTAGVLRIPAAHHETGTDPAKVAVPLAAELWTLAGWLGLSGVVVGRRGNLASPLRQAVSTT